MQGTIARRHRRLAAGITALALALALVGCSAGTPAPTNSEPAAEMDFDVAQDGFLTIATYGSNPPVNIDNPDGTLGGIEGDLLNSFAEKYGLQVKLQPTTFASMILEVQQGRADMGLFVYWTEERAQTLYYSSALLKVPAVVFTEKGFDYEGPDSLAGEKIGVIVGQVWAELMQKELGEDALLFQSQPQAAQALLNGQIKGYVTGLTQMFNAPLSEHQDEIDAHELVDGDWNMPESVLQNTGYNVVSCENSALATALDEHLQEMIDSGTWEETFSALPDEFTVDETVPPTQGC
ncbi:MAG: amino acid transporter substrate-binding protein family [Rhodoglobus sp.]|nr:amino acid transporter substrate-binding protein family [Rhodoglobus sp.]